MTDADLSALNTLTAALILAPTRWASLISDARPWATTPAMRGALDALADAYAEGHADPLAVVARLRDGGHLAAARALHWNAGRLCP